MKRTGQVHTIPIHNQAPLMDPAEDGLRDAACRGDVGIVRAMLADGRVDPAAYESIALRHAAFNGRLAVVKELLADGRADPAAFGGEALLEATRQGFRRTFQALLADGRADPAAADSKVLVVAVIAGNTKVVQALLADGRADPAVAHSGILVTAAELGDGRMVRALLSDGRADPAARNSCALRAAAVCSNFPAWKEIVSDLLADGRSDPAAVSLMCCASHGWPLVNAACRWRRRRQWLRAGAYRATGGWKMKRSWERPHNRDFAACDSEALREAARRALLADGRADPGAVSPAYCSSQAPAPCRRDGIGKQNTQSKSVAVAERGNGGNERRVMRSLPRRRFSHRPCLAGRRPCGPSGGRQRRFGHRCSMRPRRHCAGPAGRRPRGPGGTQQRRTARRCCVHVDVVERSCAGPACRRPCRPCCSFPHVLRTA
jgi:hypothetical protein